jgi:hypothetical protein
MLSIIDSKTNIYRFKPCPDYKIKTMEPKEKARELVQRFYFSLPNNGGETGICNVHQRWEEGKTCALIAVDEIIRAHIHNEGVRHLKWWQEVKEEIQKL